MNIGLILSLASLLLIAYLYTYTPGPLPPAGAFFHPSHGFWANAETSAETGEMRLPADRLLEPVEVWFDERRVPHIFARNEHDLYFVQGYVTARDRLFQMELQIRAAGGKLAEWLGSDLISYDLNQRRLGMLYGAERAMEAIGQDELVSAALRAYADGVNAYVETLSYKSYPLEYKILNVAPQQWEPLHTALLLKYMTQTLAGRSEAQAMSNAVAWFGEEFADRYLSTRSVWMDPVIPPGTPWDFEPLTRERPDTLFQASFTREILPWQPDPLNGSNNWAVRGERTAGGYPLLSNDMHLNMTLPSIWYEIQLHTPEMNVYGVSLPGSPAVIVGFNEFAAWGSTNTGADVMDWLEITFQDETRSHYLYEGEWLPVRERVETVRVKGEEAVTERILFTHHGPVFTAEESAPGFSGQRKNQALRWIAHDASNELLTFYRLNRAENVEDFREAFRTYRAPAQNMVYADIHGDIAMQTGGVFPLKWEFQGRTVGDGSDAYYDWEEYIPYDHNPYSLNPEQGYLSAANQYPADVDYPYYLGDFFAPFERGRRANDLLRETEQADLDYFREMLMDDFSYHAYKLLPELLVRVPEEGLSSGEQEWIGRLLEWDYRMKGDLTEPSVFNAWWSELNRAIWNNKYDTGFPMARPSRDRTVQLILEEPDSFLFNDISTEERETLDDLILSSFRSAMERLGSRYGEDQSQWLWGDVNRTPLEHVAQIPGLGIANVFTNGGAETLNAIRGSHGPSWRMVVELDPEGVRGYGVYPGGQSGNPGSPAYDEFVEAWRTGELFELNFLRGLPQNREGFPLVMRFE
ncbi:MAG: penicillin acylase family protein [Balneolaceae bacterium]|nr:MAG: penicillin acylase family protein [Balneolaceae bacterium]